MSAINETEINETLIIPAPKVKRTKKVKRSIEPVATPVIESNAPSAVAVTLEPMATIGPMAVSTNDFDTEMIELENQRQAIIHRQREITIRKRFSDIEFQERFFMNVRNDLVMQKATGENTKGRIRNRIGSIQLHILEYQRQIAEYERQISDIDNDAETIDNEINAIDELDYTGDIQALINEKYKEKAIEYVESGDREINRSALKPRPKPKANNNDISSVSTDSRTSSNRKKPVTYDRKTQFRELEQSTVLTINMKGISGTFTKIGNNWHYELSRTLESNERVTGVMTNPKALNELGQLFLKSCFEKKQTLNAWDHFKINGQKLGDYCNNR